MRCFQFAAQGAWATGPIDEGDVLHAAYTGRCTLCACFHSLSRTHAAVRAALSLQSHLVDAAPTAEPKMYGVLVGVDEAGRTGQLWAYSGTIPADIGGRWVPSPDLPPEVLVQERETLSDLTELSVEIRAVRHELQSVQNAIKDTNEGHEAGIAAARREREIGKLTRHAERAHLSDQDEVQLERLRENSRQENSALRRLKRALKDDLQPLHADRDALEANLGSLRRQRRALSRGLQAQMHEAARLMNFQGVEAPVGAFHPTSGPPTGTGECCAPKLLHYAARTGIKPLGMAEFFWDPDGISDTKTHRAFYGPCEQRCVPLMPHLLCGLDHDGFPRLPDMRGVPLRIVYEDEDLIVVDKPSGLSSVPGRHWRTSDNVISRVAIDLKLDTPPLVVHRLDVDTSGLLLVARTPQAQSALSKAFQERRVTKQYIAQVEGRPREPAGVIDLALTYDPQERPKQIVSTENGKPSETHYRVVSTNGDTSVIEFSPITGRTHQLRVHAAHPAGLGCPILGDALYGTPIHGQRLCLHAAGLAFNHPTSGERLSFSSEPNFKEESP